MQARKKSPWLLFLTTRVGKGHIHRDSLTRLCELYERNLAECEAFQEVSDAKFGIGDKDTLAAARGKGRGLQSIVLVGICKWLLGFAVKQTPPTIMEVKNLLGYRVKTDAEVEDMVSIAIRFNPTHEILPDAANLVSILPAKPDECDLAAKVANRVSSLLDVDAYLCSEQTVREEMTEAMCVLLESARYDIENYRKWLESQGL